MLKLNNRQKKIIEILKINQQISNREIVDLLSSQGEDVSRYSVIRDLDELLRSGRILKTGQGRNVRYEIVHKKNSPLEYIDLENYFSIPPDRRSVLTGFNFEVYENLQGIISEEEKARLNKKTVIFQNNLKNISPTILKKEFERLTIELSWKSSQIEGNTYSLLETEALLKEMKVAKGKKKEETFMILNHKKAMEYVRDRKSDFQKLSLRKIENLHQLLVGDLGIQPGIRKRLMGITGTKYRPLDNEFQIKEAVEKLVRIINAESDCYSKSMMAMLMIAYIQPFEDGNKRTSRLLGNALLMAHDLCPLSFRSLDEVEYKKAVILFYEQNNITYFKQLFIEQYEFAVDTYFLA
jgi:Fe2+ or Zn2+ uptake regulation protein/fido (protein-threonine AMPylation protein)